MSVMQSQKSKAESFRKMHHGKHLLVLPNAWDVPSARIFEDAGFSAIATSSAGLMVSLGFQDGETLDRTEFFRVVGRIARTLNVPLSADILGGYASGLKSFGKTASMAIRSGAVGVNLEDSIHSARRLIPIKEQLKKIDLLQQTGRELGVPIVVNARTDALNFGEGDSRSRMKEAIRRCIAYRDAGADCVYPMGLVDESSISKFVSVLDHPVNVMVRKGLPSVDVLERIGVARVSFGPSASYAAMGLLKRVAEEVMSKGTYTLLTEDAISYTELNNLALPGKGRKPS